MTRKKLSEKSKSYISEISEQFQIMSKGKEEIDRETAAGNEKLLTFLNEVQPWYGLYSLSYQMRAYLFYEFLGYGEWLLVPRRG